MTCIPFPARRAIDNELTHFRELYNGDDCGVSASALAVSDAVELCLDECRLWTERLSSESLPPFHRLPFNTSAPLTQTKLLGVCSSVRQANERCRSLLIAIQPLRPHLGRTVARMELFGEEMSRFLDAAGRYIEGNE